MQRPAGLLARGRRSILPSPGFKVIETAFALDESFMKQFYNRHQGNTTAAEAEVELFVALLVNEIGTE
ncbi:hypothetical protein DPMN_079601 [Dreissena polymorpha]|uniref:Uncharacterized protein n=1 Tax=Dreissena polymorpha TaxID=45954 RepID=A0A9D3YSV6_DREPO|nr:hypothetical protein DPMN_079601 [Dreissena polymorpha]